MSIDPESGATIPDGATSPFPNPGETAQDYDAQAQAEVITQFRESTKLRQTISDLMAGWQAIEDCMVTIGEQLDPAIAEGDNLDVIGQRIGQSRVLITGTELSDADYRLIIAQRILRNRAVGSGPEFVTALEFVFDPTPFRFIDLGYMSVIVEIATGAPPSDDQIALLDYGPMPRAMAVGVGRDWYDPASYFAFADDVGAGAKGFGEIGDATKGGPMAEIF